MLFFGRYGLNIDWATTVSAAELEAHESHVGLTPAEWKTVHKTVDSIKKATRNKSRAASSPNGDDKKPTG